MNENFEIIKNFDEIISDMVPELDLELLIERVCEQIKNENGRKFKNLIKISGKNLKIQDFQD